MNGQVRRERSNWRDESISKRHREWGFDCPATDIDFMLVEYDRHVPKALVEYKHENADCEKANSGMQALVNLGNMAAVPVFGVRYAGDWSWLDVVPLNKHAKSFLQVQTRMSEVDYRTFLLRLRGR